MARSFNRARDPFAGSHSTWVGEHDIERCRVWIPETQYADGTRTQVTHVHGDDVLPVGYGRLLADIISGAEFVELPGKDHFAWWMPNWCDLLDTHCGIAVNLAARVEHEAEPGHLWVTSTVRDRCSAARSPSPTTATVSSKASKAPGVCTASNRHSGSCDR